MFISKRFRREASTIMLPIMIIYTVLPGTAFGGSVNAGVSSQPVSQSSGNNQDMSQSRYAQAAATKLNSAARQVAGAMKVSQGEESASPSSSAASGYTMGIGAEVNLQTGQLDVTFNDIKLPGISEDTALSLGISNSGGIDKVYGMPAGWKFSIDYIDTRAKKLYMNGSRNYTIDPTYYSYDSDGKKYYSGLRYCANKGIKFEDKGSDIKLPYSGDMSYRYILSTQKGVNEYFDYYGKLICQDDRFGNHIIYRYDTDKNPYTAKLTGITDSFGQNIDISNNGMVITVTMPDGRSASYDFSKRDKITVTGVTGRQAYLYLDSGKIVKIEYPTGGTVEYIYANNAISYKINGQVYGFNGIKQIVQHPGGNAVNIVTDYNYESRPGHNFTGIGVCSYSSGEDALMQSHDNGYRYATKVTSRRSEACGGTIDTEQTFNFLHLPLSAKVMSNGNTLTESTTEYIGSTNGNFPAYNQLKSNYNLPKAVTSTTSGRERVVSTNYDDYGNAVLVEKYNKGQMVSRTQTSYGTYGNVTLQVLYDSIEGSTTTTENELSSDGRYVKTSRVSINRMNGGERTAATTKDVKGRTIATVLSNGSESSFAKTEYVNNSNILTVTNTNALGNSSSKTVDISSGQIKKMTDAMGNSVQYIYEANGLILTKTYPDGSWEKVDSRDPNKVVSTSSDGVRTISILDGFGREIEHRVQYPGEEEIIVLKTTYNELGKAATETDVFGHTINYTYDYQGRVASRTDYLGNVVKYAYDDGAQSATEYINGIAASISCYDDNGNVTKQTSLLSGSNINSMLTYNGKNLETASELSLEGEGRVAGASMRYDVEGALIGAIVTTADGTNGSSEYDLDLFGGVISRTTKFESVSPGVEKDSSPLTSEIKTYNEIGKLTTLRNQKGQVIYYTYDKNGNLATMEDFAGNVSSYSYDKMNRMVKMTGPEYSVINEYYEAGTKAEGKLKTKTLLKDGKTVDKMTYGYDTRGRLASVMYMDGKKMSMTYDNYDRVTTLTDYAGNINSYTYDNTIPDNILSVSNNFGNVSFTYYTKADNVLFGDGKTLKSLSYSNGVSVTYKYNYIANKAPQLASVETRSREKGLISGSYYQYDNRDRVIALTQKSDANRSDSNCNNVRYFTYNDMNQLIKEDVYDASGVKITSTSYTFDTRGNIINRVISSKDGAVQSSNEYEYNAINQLTRLTENGSVKNFFYDPNGNMTDIVSNNVVLKHFVYNTLNQLIEYKDKEGVDVCYEYNAESLRKSKYYANNKDKKIRYYYSTGGEIMNEADSSGLMSSYLMAGGRALRAIGDKVEWYIKNGKDVVATVDNSQKNTNVYNYNAYGEDTNLNEQGKVVPKKNTFDINDNPYKYSGYYLDEESGMYYLQARYYSPELMRFISRDTYDLSNRYAYCDGNPISNVDPGGHMPEAVNWALVGLAIASSALAIIFSCGAASPLVAGLGIAGGVLSLASCGTQVGSMVTQGETSEALGWASLGLGVAGMALDFAGIGVAGLKTVKALKVSRSEVAWLKRDLDLSRAFERDALEGANRARAAEAEALQARNAAVADKDSVFRELTTARDEIQRNDRLVRTAQSQLSEYRTMQRELENTREALKFKQNQVSEALEDKVRAEIINGRLKGEMASMRAELEGVNLHKNTLAERNARYGAELQHLAQQEVQYKERISELTAQIKRLSTMLSLQ